MHSRIWTLLLASWVVLAPVRAATESSERRLALVIGNAAYESEPLINPVNDARAISTALEAVGFKTTRMENGDQRAMKQAIDTFGEQLRGGGVGLFYFSGHGLQLRGRNYLVPVGARIGGDSDVEYEAVDAGRVLGKMADAGNEVNVVILDACRNNPFTRSFRSVSKGLAMMDAPSGAIVAYATAPGDVASDNPSGATGLYTTYLLKHLAEPGLRVEDVLKRVRIDVIKQSERKQIPWESSSLVGDFYFIPPERVNAPPPAPESPSPTPTPTPSASPSPVPSVSALPTSPDELPIEELRVKARAGDGQAQRELGDRYLEGDGVGQDDATAVSWYRKAAEQGDSKAQFSLALCYQLGEGVPADVDQGRAWMRKSAKKNFRPAELIIILNGGSFVNYAPGQLTAPEQRAAAAGGDQVGLFMFGWYLSRGQGSDEELELWHKWTRQQPPDVSYGFRRISEELRPHRIEARRRARETAERTAAENEPKAAALKAQEAAAEAAPPTTEPTSPPPPEKELTAVESWREDAANGSAEAQYNLGLCYERGQDVPKSGVEAARWYKKAAQQGHREAQFCLAELHYRAVSIPQDYAQAAYWYRKAADQGHSGSQTVLGEFYRDGNGVRRDAAQAALWLGKGADQGDSYAQYSLAQLYRHGKGVTKDPLKEAALLLQSASQGHSLAQHDLAFCYANGKGVTQNPAEAVRWYRKAAEQGFRDSQYSLGAHLAEGVGVPRDLPQSIRWLRKAAVAGHPKAAGALAKVEKALRDSQR